MFCSKIIKMITENENMNHENMKMIIDIPVEGCSLVARIVRHF